MTVNPIDKLVAEWAYRCKKGYPDINNLEDKKVLEEVMQEWKLNEAVRVKTDQVTQGDLQTLRSALDNIKEDYAKYLAVFYYFDPNSLGTISEVLLAKLLDTQDNISAVHTGESQGLDDIVVNGKRVSLKTTASGKYIGLGSDRVEVSPESSRQVVETLNRVGKELLDKTPVKNLKSILESDVYEEVVKRLTAIAGKIAGSSEDDFFIWIEKKYDKSKFLTEIHIHTLNYDQQKVLEEFGEGYIYTTGSAWGLKNKEGKVVVQADSTGKVLNISPMFVRSTSKDSVIVVKLDTVAAVGALDLRKEINSRVLKALDTVYSELLGKS